MVDLASFDDFVAEDAPIWARLEVIEYSAQVGIMALLFVAFGTQWDLRGVEFWRSFTLAIAMGTCLGLLIASVAFVLNRRKQERKVQAWLQRVFAADPAVVPPAPGDATCRLACSAVLPNRRRIPGMLYVRPDELAFQPHYFRQPWWKRGPKEIPPVTHIGPPTTIVLGTGFLPLRHRLLRSVGSRPMPVLICEWVEGYALFRVPRTEATCGRLQARVDELRRGGQVTTT